MNHHSLLYPCAINSRVEDPKVNLGQFNEAILLKHFVDGPISAKSALVATTRRKRRTSSGGIVNYNTVFECPDHLMKVAYWDVDRGRFERYVSPRALEAFQCYFDDTSEKWRAGYVGLVWFVLTMQDHLDVKCVSRQFQYNYKHNSLTLDDFEDGEYNGSRGL